MNKTLLSVITGMTRCEKKKSIQAQLLNHAVAYGN